MNAHLVGIIEGSHASDSVVANDGLFDPRFRDLKRIRPRLAAFRDAPEQQGNGDA